MNIPSVPLTQMTDKDGNVTTSWRIYFEQISRTFQILNLVTLEELTSAEIAAIPSGDRNSRMIYDTDLGMLFMGVNDSFIEI